MLDSLAVPESQGQDNALAEFYSAVAAAAILVAIACGILLMDSREKKASAPEKVEAFNSAFGYRLTVNEVISPMKRGRIEQRLIQNLVDTRMAELLSAYAQKEAELAILRGERDKIGTLVPRDPRETAAAVAAFNSLVGKIEQTQAELAAIKASWIKKGAIARDCGFNAPFDDQFGDESWKNKGSPKQGSAGSEPRSGFSYIKFVFDYIIFNGHCYLKFSNGYF